MTEIVVQVQCPHCKTLYDVSRDHVGLTAECEDCGQEFRLVPPRGFMPAMERRAPEAADWPVRHDLVDSDSGNVVISDFELTLVRVEPGVFLQGAQNGYVNEAPVRKAELTQAFWMARVPVSQWLYRKVLRSNPSYNHGNTKPVDSVSWHHAQEFCYALTKRLRDSGELQPGAHFRLPSECEWEYACRTAPGAEDNSRSLADPVDEEEHLDECAWYHDNSGGETHDVAAKKPNARGLYDMVGNVGEWCLDWYAPYTSSNVVDPFGPGKGRRKVRRGGSWNAIAHRCRSTERIGVAPEYKDPELGFRVVLALG